MGNIAGETHGTFLCSYWLNQIKDGLLLADHQFGAFFPHFSDIMKAPKVTLCVLESGNSAATIYKYPVDHPFPAPPPHLGG
jgi:hypothetical protein